MHTTINELREHDPDDPVIERLSKTYADDAPIKISAIFASNGIEAALWCLRAVDGYDKELRLYAVWCVRQVQHLLTDKRSLAALDVAERHAYGRASDAELDAAWAAAWEAAASTTASDAGLDAAWAAASAARAAAREAAGEAAAGAASAAEAAARAAASTAQAAKLCEVCELIEATHVHNDK